MPTARVRTLDIFRGATVAAMIGVNNPGSWQHLYPPLAHAAWHGWTFTDLVFPFFLMAVGLSLALVTPALLAAPRAAFWRKWLVRGLGLIAIGLVLNALSLPRWEAGQLVLRGWADWRLMGVLQRIGLAWMAAAVLVLACRARVGVVAAVAAALLVGYHGLCIGLGAPGDAFSLEGFFGTVLDRALLGPRHLYQGEGVPFDPEGLASTLPAVAQVLLGWLAGTWLGPVLSGRPPTGPAGGPLASASASAGWGLWPAQPDRRQALTGLVAAGLLALVLAQAWAPAMPINKKLWTSSYVLLTTGLGLWLLAALLWVLKEGGAPPDRQRTAVGAAGAPAGALHRAWRALWHWLAAGAEACGRNALAVFVLSGLVPRLLTLVRLPDGLDAATGLPRRITPLAWLYREVAAPLAADPRFGSLVMALGQVLLYALLARAMARRGWFIRL